MGKTDPEQPASGRKRQLNLIFFVDASRTRTINLPLFQVNVLLFALAAVVIWSVGGIFALMSLHKEKEDLAARLRTSMATVFDYEVRHDGVYEVAYPGGKREVAEPAASPVAAGAKGAPTKGDAADDAASAALQKLAMDDPKANSGDEPSAAPVKMEKPEVVTKKNALDAKLPVKTPPAPIAVAKAAPAPTKSSEPPGGTTLAAKNPPAAPQVKTEKTSATLNGAESANIVVGNPVIESAPNSLQLRFDLTNKSNGRAEGYIWAVAAFKSDKGDTTYIADPPSMVVGSTGEPLSPLKSSNFGIRHFKKISFSFPVKGENGTFTGIRIGITDKAGANRSTYNVPVEIRVGKNDVDAGKKTDATKPDPKSL